MDRTSNLVDEAMAMESGGVVLIEDCVETNGAFILHHLIKRHLSPPQSSLLIFVAFAQPFSHYDRILRKMGCNLVVQRDNKRLLFLDMLMLECPDGDGSKTCEVGLRALFGKIQKAVEVGALAESKGNITIMIDDISLMEVAAHGSSNHVLDFLQYCHTLTTQFGCSLVALNHKDVYLSRNEATLILQLEHLADVVIKVEPLATGLATDVHGQVTVINKGRRIEDDERFGRSMNKLKNFHFRVKDNIVDYFYPGSRT
ncbi:hypothetical protein LguiA_023623 [Lonicera macranthoides]